MTKTKPVQEKLVTRAEVERMFNLYHYLHHTPWHRKLWRKVKAKFQRAA